MSSLTILICISILNSITPISLSIIVLMASLISALTIFNTTITSWVSLILIIIFSSGIITLFIYVASLTPNENSNTNTPAAILPLLTLSAIPSFLPTNQSNTGINVFSSQSLVIFITLILILALLTISIQTFNPQQTLSSTF